jgi:hypothetical protein
MEIIIAGVLLKDFTNVELALAFGIQRLVEREGGKLIGYIKIQRFLAEYRELWNARGRRAPP